MMSTGWLRTEVREFGNSGLKVSVLGYGAGQLGTSRLTEQEADKFLNAVLDVGVTLVDTARGYGQSEERIGKFLSHRRNEFVLSTKVGYDVEGYQDWTYDCIIAGVERALRLMRTDVIDIVHLHSCPVEILKNGEVVDALEEMVEQGKVRVAAYSGENEALDYAVSTGRFGSVQFSLNITDQRSIEKVIPTAKRKGIGIIAKRPIANAPWRFADKPVGDYAEEYWVRWKKMNLKFGIDPQELFLRFSAFTDGVGSCIVGTTNIDHLRKNIQAVGKGPLPADIVSAIRKTFKENDA
ncbi:MAG: aldo/keto reductase, partial [Bacteroidetes bacterium]|nr:aldo/keto reductase [Bacteroidota bacterium]